MDIETRDEPTTTLAVRRGRARLDELPAFYDGAYGAVAAAIGTAGGTIVGPAIGWYAGMPSETVDLAAGFPVTGVDAGALPEGVELMELAGGRVAVGRYIGSYEGLGAAWGDVEKWRASHDEHGRGDFWEVYVSDPSPGGDPNANETLLVLPLA